MKYEDHGYYLEDFQDFRHLVGKIPLWDLVERVATFIEANPDRECNVCGKGFKHHDSVNMAPLFDHLSEDARNLITDLMRDFELTYEEIVELNSSRAQHPDLFGETSQECEGSPGESCSLAAQTVEGRDG